MKNDTVYIYRVPDYADASLDAAVEAIFAASDAAKHIAGAKVLLKPNLLAKHEPDKAVTTHPAVVAAVIRAVKRRRAAQIILADSPGGVYNTGLMKSLYKVSGLADVCAAEGVECYDACQWGPRAQPDGTRVREFNLLQPVLEADFIIDLPKLKTHVMTGLTAATKNLFGCVPGLQKGEFHMRFPQNQNFGEMLIDLLETVKPDLCILDAVDAMEGDGPAGGEQCHVGLLLGGENPLTLDLCCADLIGLAPQRVPYMAAAMRRGLCAAKFDPALLAGQPDAFALIPGYKLPGSYAKGDGDTDFAGRMPGFLRPIYRAMAPHPVINTGRCIGCGKCAEICPGHTIKVDKKAQIDPAGCIRCFCCHEVCPVKAIDVKQFSLLKKL